MENFAGGDWERAKEEEHIQGIDYKKCYCSNNSYIINVCVARQYKGVGGKNVCNAGQCKRVVDLFA